MRLFLFILVFVCLLAPPAPADAALSISNALELARQKNPAMQEARLTIRILETVEKNSRLRDNPELDLTVAKIAPDLSAGEGFDDRALEGEVRLNQPVDVWGKRRLRVEMSGHELRQAQDRLDRLWLDVRHDVKRQYNHALLEAKRIDLARDYLDQAQRLFDQVNIRFNAGKARTHELARARLEVATARNGLLKAETNHAVAAGRLNILMGRDMDVPVILQDSLTFERISESLTELTAAAITGRADITDLTGERDKSDTALRLSRRERWPDITLGFFVEKEEGIYSAGAGVSFDLPLWNRSGPQIDAAALRVEIAQLRLDSLKQEAALDVYAAYKKVTLTRQTVENLRQAIQEANELLRILNIEYQEGEVLFLTYIEGLNSFKQTKQDYLTALADYNDKVAELEQAAGRSVVTEE